MLAHLAFGSGQQIVVPLHGLDLIGSVKITLVDRIGSAKKLGPGQLYLSPHVAVNIVSMLFPFLHRMTWDKQPKSASAHIFTQISVTVIKVLANIVILISDIWGPAVCPLRPKPAGKAKLCSEHNFRWS